MHKTYEIWTNSFLEMEIQLRVHCPTFSTIDVYLVYISLNVIQELHAENVANIQTGNVSKMRPGFKIVKSEMAKQMYNNVQKNKKSTSKLVLVEIFMMFCEFWDILLIFYWSLRAMPNLGKKVESCSLNIHWLNINLNVGWKSK